MVVTNKINYGWNYDVGMMLHLINFNRPVTNERLTLNAKINEEFNKVGSILNLDLRKYQ
jgi:tRNA pseudouridine65 synthase